LVDLLAVKLDELSADAMERKLVVMRVDQKVDLLVDGREDLLVT